MSVARVQVDVQAKAEVTYKSLIRVTYNDGYGSTAQCSWDNPSMMEGLAQMFGVKPHEEVVALEITERGIAATIRKRR